MASGVVTRKRSTRGKPKVKTGCATCRIRKVKCDEGKPCCRKCVDTGRTCDGYESPFRILTTGHIQFARAAGGFRSDRVLKSNEPIPNKIYSQDVDLLNRYFSTKTMFDVKLGCDEEARQVLQASLTDPYIRHAVRSLRALREELEESGDDPALVMQRTSSNSEYGLQQYNIALSGLASRLSSVGSHALQSTLLCCQIFISIEQVRGDYAAMALHIIRGLGIMHEHQARPYFVTANEIFVPAHHDQSPMLDVFIIKLFAAPCKFADRPTTSRETPACPLSPRHQTVQSRNVRSIAPDVRMGLTKIATSTLEFLGKIARIKTLEDAQRLLSDKAALFQSLELWLIDLDTMQTRMVSSSPEPLSMTFMRLFHSILKIVLLGTLCSSRHLHVKLREESDRLQDIASDVSEKVKAYGECSRDIGG